VCEFCDETDGQCKIDVTRDPSCVPQPAGCRTTGGGRQDATAACPLLDPLEDREVIKVTHGGQVGAPFAHESAPRGSDAVIDDPSTTCDGTIIGLNNECIRGEWEHVRHLKGGRRANFHAASNGNVHQFDSLMCACLKCTGDADFDERFGAGACRHNRDYIGSDELVLDGESCNPRKQSPFPECGPEPRPAPANKIAFSGLGDYTGDKGKKNAQVVFRVDLEDRSEPGGFKPGGSTPPPDRYRIRMWFVDGLEEDEIATLRCQVAVHDPLKETVLTDRLPDIDDGGDLDRGNHQIHPVTGADAKCVSE
jgi:hypothetical protein